MNLDQLLLRTARVFPQQPAIAHGERALFAYGEVARQVSILAGCLRGRFALAPGDRVAVFMGRSPACRLCRDHASDLACGPGGRTDQWHAVPPRIVLSYSTTAARVCGLGMQIPLSAPGDVSCHLASDECLDWQLHSRWLYGATQTLHA